MKRGVLQPSKAYTSPVWGSSLTTWAGGWTVDRMRRAIEAHDRGSFGDSTRAAEKVTQWAIVLGALAQRVAPVLRFPRSVEGAAEGLDGVVRKEVEALFVGQRTTLGPGFPSLATTVWQRAMLGFCWWQTVYTPSADGSTVTPITTVWPADSTAYDMGRNTWVAITIEEGLIDIEPNSERWTLVAEGDKPWLDGAIRAIGSEYVDAIFAKDDRSSYSDEHGRPKPIGILPEGVKTNDENGKAAFEALETLRESEAGAMFPHGTDVKELAPNNNTALLFRDILDSAGMAVAIALLGTDGTMSKGSGGVYSSPTFAGVAETRVGADVAAIERACRKVATHYVAKNYGDRVTVIPRPTIQMPDTQRDARTESYTKRLQAFYQIAKSHIDGGFELTQPWLDELARKLDVLPAPQLGALGQQKTGP